MQKTLMVIGLTLVVFAGGAVNGAELSCLFFTSDELSEIRTNVSEGVPPEEYQQMISEAEALLDPLSKKYADPDAVTDGYGSQEIKTRGSLLCRRFSTWIETLGFAYQLSLDKKYAEPAIQMMLNACDPLSLDGPIMSVNLPGGRGDMIHALAFGYDLLGELMTPEQKQKLFTTGAPFVEDALKKAQDPQTGWYKYHNWNGVAGGAAGLFSLAVRADYPKDSIRWKRQAIEVVERWLNNGFDDQGAYLEGISYSSYGLENGLLFAAALLNSGGPNLFETPSLKALPKFYAASLLPGLNVYEARNDSNYTGVRAQVLALAKFNRDGLAKWLWNQTGSAKPWQKLVWHNHTPPQSPEEANVPLAQYFKGRGLCIWRTGWQKKDVLFSVEAGPYYAITHNQADKGSFGFYSHSHKWAMDAGYGNNQTPHGRSSTFAHNCVLIDGQGQAVSGAGLGTNGKVLEYEDNPQFGRCVLDETEAYTVNNRGQPGVGVEYAFRQAVFIKPDKNIPAYAVLLDDMVKDGRMHEFTWQMLTEKDMKITVMPDGAVLVPGLPDSAGSPRCILKIAATNNLRLEKTDYRPNDGRQPDAMQKIQAKCTAVNPSFAAVLLALSGDQSGPQVSFNKQSRGLSIQIIWPDRTDLIFWPDERPREPVVQVAVGK